MVLMQENIVAAEGMKINVLKILIFQQTCGKETKIEARSVLLKFLIRVLVLP